MSTPYDGRILLVDWVPSTTPGETIDGLARLLRAKVPNVAGVMLKTSNGVSWQGHLGNADPSPQAVTGVTRIRQWVDEFAQYGLEVHVWGVPRAKRPPEAMQSPDIQKEAEKFVAAASVPGITSLLLDVEHGSYYWLGTPDEVRDLMGKVRAGVPNGFHIGMILDGRRNRDFGFWVDPWIPFVDSLHPMVYPILFSTDYSIKTHLDVAFRNLGPYDKPIVPMLQAFGEHSRRPTPEEIIQQGNLAWANGATGISFFRLGCDIWGGDLKPHMGEPEYAAIAQIPVLYAPGITPEVPPQPDYTWQDVINAAALIAVRADASYDEWLGEAGLWSVFDNSLRPLPYSGPPIRHWPLADDHRQAIITALETYSSEQLVQLYVDALADKGKGRSKKGGHGAAIGIHGAPGTAAPPPHMWDTWIEYLKEMGIKWYKQCDNGADDLGPHSIFAWCKRLKAEGIEPIIRYLTFPQFPDPLPDHQFEKMRHYAGAGIVWAEIGNEPNLDIEWKDPWRNREGYTPMRHTNPEVIRMIAETWVRDAQKALEVGVRPAFYAFGATDWRGGSNPLYSSVFFIQKVVGYLAQRHHAATLDIFQRGGWIAVHAATFEQPADFDPYRSDATVWDMTLRGYEVVLRAFREHFGADVPIDDIPVISTEGGVFTPESTSMEGHIRLSTGEEHAQRVVEMFRWLEQNSPLRAMCPWCISVGGMIGHYHAPFRHDGWIEEIGGGLRPRAVVDAMKQLRFDNERLNEQTDIAHTMVKLDVPYISQFDETAQTHQADCGPACMAMILNADKALSEQVTVDELYQHHLPDKEVGAFTFLGEMEKIGQGEGVSVRRLEYQNSDEALQGLRDFIQQDTPFVVLVNYVKWDEIAGNYYADVHFVVVVGFDDEHIFVHDPLFRGARRGMGTYFVWRNQRFLEGWGSAHEFDRPDFVALVPDKQVSRLKSI